MLSLEENISKDRWKVYVIASFAVILWGLSYIWSDQLLSMNIPVEYFVFIRSLMAGCILFLVNLVWGIDLRIKKADLPKFFLLAFCEPFVYFVCETYGLNLTESPTYSSLIIATTPIFSMVVGLFLFKERFSIINIAGLLICLAGLAMVIIGVSSIGRYFVWGVILLVVAVFAEVGHASCTKMLSGTYYPLVITMYQFLIGSVYLLPLFLTKGIADWTPLYFKWDIIGPILSLAVFCSSMAFSLWVSAIRTLGVAKSSVFTAMIPIVTAIASSFTGSDQLSSLQWIGIGVGTAGVILSQYNNGREKKINS